MTQLKQKTGTKNGHSYYGIIKYGPSDVTKIVDSNNGSRSRSRSGHSKSPVRYYQQIANSKEKKSSNFLDRYLKIRGNKAVSAKSSPAAAGKMFKKSQRHLALAQKASRQVHNQISIVENSILAGTPRENGPTGQLSSYKNLMSFKNSKSNEQLRVARNLESSLNRASSKNISLGTEKIMFSSIHSKKQIPLQIETSSPL